MTTTQDTRPAACHLVELTPVAGLTYSAALGYLHATAQAAPELGGRYRFRHHIVEQRDRQRPFEAALLDQLESPDVVAFSVYFWNRTASLLAARAVKERWPDCTVIVGGVDVTWQADAVFAEAPWVDIVVHGEGELTFVALLRALAGDGALDDVAGISYTRDGATVTTAPSERIADLETVASPLLSGVFSAEEISASNMVVYETNRGCPYSCAFCFWGGATNTRVRKFSDERVRAEISHLARHVAPLSTIFIADANFGMLPRDLELTRWLVEELQANDKKVQIFANWAKQTNKNVVAAATLLYQSGMIGAVTLTAQSFDQQTLTIAKRKNIKIDHYRALQDTFREAGIPTYTELIWGMPGESLPTFTDGLETVLDKGGTPVVYPLLLLNNTEYSSEAFRHEYGMETRALPYELSADGEADTHGEFVVAHRSMTTDDWLDGLDLAFAVSLFHKALLRAPLVWLHERGARITTLCQAALDAASGPGADDTLRAIIANHRTARLERDQLDVALLDRVFGDDRPLLEEHIHYQAVLYHLASDGRRLEQFVEWSGQALWDAATADPEVKARVADAEPEYRAVLRLQHALLSVLEVAVRHVTGDTSMEVPVAAVRPLLEGGHLRPTGTLPEAGSVRVWMDPERELAHLPSAALLIQVYFGMTQLLWRFDRLSLHPA